MGTTLALVSEKGGTAKTTTAVNLAAALARRQRHILTADLDSQASLTAHLGASGFEFSAADVLDGGVSPRAAILQEVMSGVDLLPAAVDLSGIEFRLVDTPDRELLLRNALAPTAANYDFVLIDCPPSLGLATVNALAAADGFLVCMQPDWLALRGLAQLLDTVAVVQERLNPSLSLAGVLLCNVNSRRRLTREVQESLHSRFGGDLLRTVIRENVRLAEAPSYGQSIFDYDPRCHGAEDYAALAEEMIERGKAASHGK